MQTMIWHNVTAPQAFASDALGTSHVAKSVTAASVGLSDPRRISPPPSRRKRRF